MVSICPVTGNVNCGHLIKMMSARLPHYEVIIFLFVINTDCCGRLFETMQMFFPQMSYLHISLSKTGK